MSEVRLPEPYALDAWDGSDQSWDLGAVVDANGDAVDCSGATAQALVKRYIEDDDDDAVAELTVTWGGTGNNVPTIALADDAGLEAGTTYAWSVLVEYEAEHDLEGQIHTVASGTLRMQAQVTDAVT